jgi:Uma2 family endonuclease
MKLTAPAAGVTPSRGKAARDGNGVPLLDPACVPNLDDLITRDDTPVDDFIVERQQRLLTEPLYSSWGGPGKGRPFIAAANLGLFAEPKNPAYVPDFLLSLDRKLREGDSRDKETHSYYIWLYGKAPDLILEIVSDRKGGEATHKMHAYAQMGVPFYVIYDRDNRLRGSVLRAFCIHGKNYEPIDPAWFPDLRLGLKFWEGEFQGYRRTWLRWDDKKGRIIPTGAERAEELRRRAKRERRLAEDKVKRLEAQIRALGAEPEA